jgi:hypothetical protein
MSRIGSDFLVGGVVGYFMSNNLVSFGLGVAAGIIIQEKFGSVYKFSLFCYDSAKSYISKYLPKKNSQVVIDEVSKQE